MTAAYALTTGGNVIIRAADGASIPVAPGNADYQAFLAWEAAGNTPDPAPTVAADSVITSFAYMQRFTATETAAIQTAALASPPTETSLQIFNWLMMVAAAGTIDLTNTTVTTGMAALVAAGLLTQDRATAILTP